LEARREGGALTEEKIFNIYVSERQLCLIVRAKATGPGKSKTAKTGRMKVHSCGQLRDSTSLQGTIEREHETRKPTERWGEENEKKEIG